MVYGRVQLTQLWLVALRGQCGDFRFTFGLTGRIITFIDKEIDKGVRFPGEFPGIRPFLYSPSRDRTDDENKYCAMKNKTHCPFPYSCVTMNGNFSLNHTCILFFGIRGSGPACGFRCGTPETKQNVRGGQNALHENARHRQRLCIC